MIDLKTQPQYFKKLEKLLREKLGDAETKTLLDLMIMQYSFSLQIPARYKAKRRIRRYGDWQIDQCDKSNKNLN